MIKIIDKRGTGKTSRLFKLAQENDGVIVCKHPDKMRVKAYSYGITGIDFVSYDQYFNSPRFYKNVYIDELTEFLKSYDLDIAGYSESEEDEM